VKAKRTIVFILTAMFLVWGTLFVLRSFLPQDRTRRHQSRIIYTEKPERLQIYGEIAPGKPNAAAPSPTPSGTPPIDANFRAELEQDERDLREQIARIKHQIGESIAEIGQFSPPPPENSTLSGEVIRELNFTGYPSAAVEQVMQRYGLRIEKRFVASASSTTFLSQAVTPDQKRFLGGGPSPPGIYEVFELTPQAVARMSRLEEEAIRQQGRDPAKTAITKVVFGLAQQSDGTYDFCVTRIEFRSASDSSSLPQ
jgi:hypothetical protein